MVEVDFPEKVLRNFPVMGKKCPKWTQNAAFRALIKCHYFQVDRMNWFFIDKMSDQIEIEHQKQ